MTRPGERAAFQARNPAQRYSTTFGRDGIAIVPHAPAGTSWRLGLSVTGYGYSGDVRSLPPAEPTAEKERVEYHRGPVTEWYDNRPGGLEQWFELAEPEPRRTEPLVVAMAVRGDLAAASDGSGAWFADAGGVRRVRYAGLKAWDAARRPLEARVEAMGREVRLVVESQAARFPVTVDPTFVHEARLQGHGDPVGQPGSFAGAAVSVFGDTAVVGAPFDSSPTGSGAAHVFVRSGTTWTEQQKLTPSDGEYGDDFGRAVSVAGDTLVVGAQGDDTPGLVADLGSAYVFVRSGATWTQQQKLTASDGAFEDHFGSSVSVSGDTVVVGAKDADMPGGSFNAGAAYVFVRSGTTWAEQQELTASDGTADAFFGSSVSVSGETLVVAAPIQETPAGPVGAAYVFVRSGTVWAEQQKLIASDGQPYDRFGSSVSVSGDTLVVGAQLANVPGEPDAGAAYVFTRSGTVWAQQWKLIASDATSLDNFGFSVSLSGDTVVATAIPAASPGLGSAYVFVRSGTTWSEQQKLTASDAGPDENFGLSVSVSADTVVVGAPRAGPDLSGLAYAFVRSGNTWTEQQTLAAMDGTMQDYFGSSVSVSGDTVVVGAPFDHTPAGIHGGSAYVFVRSGMTWSEQQKLLAPDGAAFDYFGWSVSVSGDTLVVGAVYGDTSAAVDAGSAYVFVRSGNTWAEQQELTASDGATADYFGSSVSISADTVVVGAQDKASAYVFARSGAVWTEQQQLPNLGASAVSVSGDTLVVGTPSDAPLGSAHVFARLGTTWTEQQELTEPGGTQGDFFGGSVSVSGDTVVVGANAGITPPGITGSAYVFVRSGTTWSEQQKLIASDGAVGDSFGWSVSVSGDTAVVGAALDDGNTGSAYVFVRSGTTWTEQQKLAAAGGSPNDFFGSSVSVSGDTVVIGAHYDDTPDGVDAGSVDVFRTEQADLSLTKTDGQTAAVPGQPLSYTITVANLGPTVATGAMVADTVPGTLLNPTWTCASSPGSSCAVGGSGSINDLVNLLVGATATYTLTATIDANAIGSLSNTATVSAPAGVDANPANDSATDTDVLMPQADLSVTNTDGQAIAIPGGLVGYTISVANAGPSAVTAAPVSDVLPAILLGATWTCSASVGSSCAANGSGSIQDTVSLLVGGSATYTLWATVDAAATGTLINTATIAAPPGATDPNASNDTATDTDTLLVGVSIESELVHGYERQHDLAALPGPAPDEDLFRIRQRPHASYEVLLDGASGDLGSGSGPFLERVASDASAVVQASSPAGAGGSRSLRWLNDLDMAVADEFVRVRSAGCTTTCDASDVYRLSVWETTGFVPRFNNSASQITVLVLQNLGDEAVDVDVRFWSGSGAALGGPTPQTLSPRATYVLNTSTIAPGSSGSITVANTGRYGQLAGKAVAVEPATGFTFDTAMASRPR